MRYGILLAPMSRNKANRENGFEVVGECTLKARSSRENAFVSV